MGKPRGRADNCIHIRVMYQVGTVAVYCRANRIAYLVCAFNIKIRYGNNFTAGKLIGNAVDVLTSDCAAAHNADSQ